MSTFAGLNTAYKGLVAQQLALNITSHNIANASTEGYTRQDVMMAPSTPYKVLQGYVGTGVDVTEFRRIRDAFVDTQIRTENKSLGELQTKADIYDKLEVVFNEPSDSSLQTVLSSYWQSWQDLSKNTDSVAVRDTTVQSGVTLADTFNQMDMMLNELQADINKGIAVKVDEINTYARQIADLNEQIVKAETDGSNANDLRDKRDLLLENLSKALNIDVNEDRTGSLTVVANGVPLVSGSSVIEMEFSINDSYPQKSTLMWLDPANGNPWFNVSVSSGTIKGYLDMRDKVIPDIQGQLSEMARRIAIEVNNLHRNGFDFNGAAGRDFFVKLDDTKPFGAGNIKVNPILLADANLVAASGDAAASEGDATVALAIAQVKNKSLMNSGIAAPQLTVAGTKDLSAGLEITADNNILNLTVNGVSKSLTLTPAVYASGADLVAEIQARLNDPASFGPGAVTASLSAGNMLMLTSNIVSPYQGVGDLSGPAAAALGIASEFRNTYDDYYSGIVGNVGVDSREVIRSLENRELLVEQLRNKRESVSGVSLDEEMTNMIKFQHAYTAAARVINTMDEMLDLIVNRLGIVGR